MPSPYGVHAASRTTAGTSSTNAATSRLLPIPASPTTTTWRGVPVVDDPVEGRSQARELVGAPDEPGAQPALGRGLAGRTPSNLPSASSSNASPPRRAAIAVSWISSGAGVVERTACPPDHRADEHGRRALDEEPPRSHREPRLDRAVAQDLTDLDGGAGGADDVVLVGAVDPERRDELDPRLR